MKHLFVSIIALGFLALAVGCGSVTEDATCDDGVANGDETDVDCGGSCGPCDDGRSCVEPADCTSNMCEGDVCVSPPECGDGEINGDDTCDDGGESATCDDDCTEVECGDGNVNEAAGEDCDDEVETATCDDDCTAVECGDTNLNETAGEDCDDGGTDLGDGCGATCLADFVNGSFETNDYTGWTLMEDSGEPTAGIWGIGIDPSTLTGLKGEMVLDHNDMVQAPTFCVDSNAPLMITATDGTHVAFQLQNDAENHRAYQDISLSEGTTMLTWDVLYTSGARFTVDSQFTAIHVRDPANDTILETLFKTADTVDDEVLPWTAQSADISAYAGMDVRIDVEHQVQDECFTAMWDNFRIQ
jgi:hypothetical protein